MVDGFKPVSAEEKIPTPVPSMVLEFAVVGDGEVLQQTPLDVTADPPPEVIFPPENAELAVILETAVVEIVAKNPGVVNVD
jgi:hypothetical protein